jgi:hypothetical protein
LRIVSDLHPYTMLRAAAISVEPIEVPGDRWMVQGLDPQGALFGLLAPTR